MNWHDPAVLSAIIQSAGSIIAAAIAGIFAAVIGKQITDRKRLEQKLALAQSDIAFLLAVEAAHCDLHRENVNESNKQRVRAIVYANGMQWSGKFTPGRVKNLAAYQD